ncbi:MAG: STM3941 family protein [Blastocatellia bacterium]
MDYSDETIIELNKTKIVLLLLGAAAFVAAGIWMFSLDAASIQSQRRLNDPMYVHGLGLVSIVFFGIFGLLALKMLFDKKPGLVFNNSGIVNNASSVSPGFIPWSEVVGAEIFEIQRQKMLIIKVRDHQEYIARGSTLRRALNKANYKMAGSPICISANALKIDFSELVSLFDQYQRKYGVGPMRHPLIGQDVRLPEASGGHVGPDGDSVKLDVEFEAQLLNWSPGAVRGTVGAGGIGILVLSLSSLDMLFHIQLPFWPAFTASLLPVFIFFLAVPDFLPDRVARPAQWFAAVWYLGFAALSISLAACRGLEAVDVLLVGFIMLGAWPCLVAVRKLRVAHET